MVDIPKFYSKSCEALELHEIPESVSPGPAKGLILPKTPVKSLFFLPETGISEELIKQQAIQFITDNLVPHLGRAPYGLDSFEIPDEQSDKDRRLLMQITDECWDKGVDLFAVSPELTEIRRRSGSSWALDALYEGPNVRDIATGYGLSILLLDRAYRELILNSVAVRNRLRVVKQQIGGSLRLMLDQGRDPIRILSVAAGSSRGIIKTVAGLRKPDQDRILMRLVDIDPLAHAQALGLAHHFGVEDNIEVIQESFPRVRNYIGGFNPDIVEIVGLADYLKDKSIIGMVGRIRPYMAPGGVMIFSNIMPNDEQAFIEKYVGWPVMEYRSINQTRGLAINAGFKEDRVETIIEPTGLYTLVVAHN